jgi:hypothetical protein
VKDDHLVARLLARCLPLALADRVRSAKEREELARRYADAAMAALVEAIPKGGRGDFGTLSMGMTFPIEPFAR